MLNELVEDLEKLMNKHNIKSISALNHEEESYIKMDDDGRLHLFGLYIRTRENVQ